MTRYSIRVYVCSTTACLENHGSIMAVNVSLRNYRLDTGLPDNDEYSNYVIGKRANLDRFTRHFRSSFRFILSTRHPITGLKQLRGNRIFRYILCCFFSILKNSLDENGIYIFIFE